MQQEQAVRPSNPAGEHDPKGFAPILNLLLNQGQNLINTVSDPARLQESLTNLIPGCQPATYADLSQVISKYVRDGLDPLVKPA
jgi:hypothetical protein